MPHTGSFHMLMFHMLMLIFAYFLAFILLCVFTAKFYHKLKRHNHQEGPQNPVHPQSTLWVFATLPLNHKLFLTARREKSIHKQTTTTEVHSLHRVILRRQVFNPWTISNDHLSWSTSIFSYRKNCSICESPRYVSPSQNTKTK